MRSAMTSLSPRYSPATTVSGRVIGPMTAPTMTSWVARLLTLIQLRFPGVYLVVAPLTTRPSIPAGR